MNPANGGPPAPLSGTLPGRLAALRARLWTHRSVPWVGTVVIGGIVASTALGIVQGYRGAVAQTGRDLEAGAQTIAEQTARSMQAVDVVLRHVATQFQHGTLAALSPEDLHAYLHEQAVGLVQTEGLVVVQPSGVARATSWRHPPPPVNVSQLNYFQYMRDNEGSDLRVGRSMISLAEDRQPVFPIARRLESSTGVFAGVVAARGRVQYFQDFYRDVLPDAGTRITLMHRDGTLLARYPPAPEALGRQFPLFDQLLAERALQPGPTRSMSPVDGVERFGAIRHVPDYPLAVVVTRDVDAALAPWRAQAVGAAARTLVLATLAALLLALATRQLARLRESEGRYERAMLGSGQAHWDWNLPTGEQYVSPRLREIYAIPADAPLATRADFIARLPIHPDDRARWQAAMDDHLAGRTPRFDIEYRILREDGEVRWLLVRGQCFRDAAGQAIHMAGSTADVTDRKRAEAALRESEDRFALAVAGSNDGVVDWDIVNDRMFTSLRAMRLSGVADPESRPTMRTRAEWTALLQIHPDDRERHDDEFRRHLAGETEVRDGEYRVKHPDGSYRWVRVRGMCVRDAEGRAVRWAGSVSDIDARKRTEQALLESQQRYQLAVAGSNEGLWDWDLPSDMLFLSPRAQQLFDFPPGEPLRPRREWIRLSAYHPDDLPRIRATLSAYLHGETPHFEVEYRMFAAGNWHFYRERGVAVRDGQGKPVRLAGSIEDITDRKTAEAQRDRLEGRLRQAQKLEAMGTLAGGIAHDFNNILAAILGYGEMVQKESAEGTPLRRHIDAAVSAGMRAKSLVERILAFSRSGMGERVPVHVQSVVAEALDLVAASLPRGVSLQRRLAAGDTAVLGDPTQIHQVVMNLCANAAQAMKTEGELAVVVEAVALHEPRVVTTSELPAGDYLRVSVQDTGTGITPQVLERIFDPFFTTKEVGVGTGLGLSLVHGIVTDLGGGIDVHSVPGQGSTFTVYLPARGVAAAPKAAQEPILTGSGETILLVDDEEPLVRLGEEMLAELGYEPVGFASSSAALESFRAEPHRFTAVLSDETMPGMTGSELARAIRGIRADIPIVLMSGYVSPGLSARARDIGVAEVLAKPLVSRDIARSLASVLRR
jgi:PAS domain S-box-containing protein